MLEIKNGNISELYVHSIDRFGKNTIDILSTLTLLLLWLMLFQRKRDYKC
jgi:DNA invertase Pin-like site-specific DNA recombinase